MMKKQHLMKLTTLAAVSLLCLSCQPRKTADDWVYSGHKKFDHADVKGAIADYTMAIESEPDEPYAYFDRAAARDVLKDYAGAIDDYTKAIELNPENARGYCSRGAARHKMRDYAGAIADYTTAIALPPIDPSFIPNRGPTWGFIHRRYTEAELAKAATTTPDCPLHVYASARATTILKIHPAIDVTSPVPAYLKPYDADAYYGRGLAKYNLGNFRGAVEDFTASISLAPDRPESFHYRGLALRSLGDKINAAADVARAAAVGDTMSLKPRVARETTASK
jgi:tetratricopeptide (TPR) repeat protein